ncbi:unnamed protein product [Blepharisma stoltei]|uniref:Uncharacterized protein n=1 Tax=Blepharisma stoltei TaxID=1481888 RepID=A0AAU9JEH9_9CILI|nr:unnamed protein product [Blepharisma stoltei]
MFSGRCSKEGCTNKLHGKCECEGTVLFCKDHLSEHVEKPASKGHRCLRLYFKPLEEIKQPLIEKLAKLKKDIKKYYTSEIFLSMVSSISKFLLISDLISRIVIIHINNKVLI